MKIHATRSVSNIRVSYVYVCQIGSVVVRTTSMSVVENRFFYSEEHGRSNCVRFNRTAGWKTCLAGKKHHQHRRTARREWAFSQRLWNGEQGNEETHTSIGGVSSVELRVREWRGGHNTIQRQPNVVEMHANCVGFLFSPQNVSGKSFERKIIYNHKFYLWGQHSLRCEISMAKWSS
jgi:hypothetical protein